MTLTKNVWAATLAVLTTLAVVVVLLFVPTQGAGATGGGDEPCTPKAAYTETTDWVLSAPEDDGWYLADEREVVDSEATKEKTDWLTAPPEGEGWVVYKERTVVDEQAWEEEVLVTPEVEAQHYSWTGGPLEEGVIPPPAPGADWQASTEKEPHKPDKVTYPIPGDGRHYTGEPGKANWFDYEPGSPAIYETVYHEAVTHQEYKYKRHIPAVTHKEYKYAYDHPAVVCETPSETPTVTITPSVPTETTTVTPPVVTETVTPPVVTETVVPTPTPDDVQTPEVTPVPEKEDEPKPDKNKPQPKPDEPVYLIECVDGVFVTTVNGEVVSENGSCVERDENDEPVTFNETGL